MNNKTGRVGAPALIDNKGKIQTGLNERKEVWYQFGRKLFLCDTVVSPYHMVVNLVFAQGLLNKPSVWEPLQRKHDVKHSLGELMTPAEVELAIDKSKCGKSGGPNDGITAEVFKCLRNYLLPTLLKIYNSCIKSGRVPKAWRKGTICNLHKGDSTMVCGNWWGIMLLNISG